MPSAHQPSRRRPAPVPPPDGADPPFLEGLAPVMAPDARVLILGSMPGEESLRRAQYYAHPRNSFWPIMGALIGAGPDIPYAARIDRLRTRRIALWDVVHRCRRTGSLDAAIDPDSIQPNDVAGLLARCPEIRRIAFNGRAAQSLFRRLIAAGLPPEWAAVDRIYLPSTSPAHASRSVRAKLASWRQVMEPPT